MSALSVVLAIGGLVLLYRGLDKDHPGVGFIGLGLVLVAVMLVAKP